MCEILKRPTEKKDAKDGYYWYLDYSYGGYLIYQVDLNKGIIREIFGNNRRTKAQFLSFLDGFFVSMAFLVSEKKV